MTLGKQKTPGGIPCGVFCFPQGKQKAPHGVPLGVFCFPWTIRTPNNRIFISSWVINENTGNVNFHDLKNETDKE